MPSPSRGREQQHHAPDVVAVFVHEGAFVAVDIGGGAGMRRQRGILVGVGLLDLRCAGQLRDERRLDREQLRGCSAPTVSRTAISARRSDD